ncbi:Cyclic di-GMP phosphodiesterase response regulator RpfG [Marinomonas aquimarina]|uniref:Cyclic di-GMP phosphodiesterase response regulator RpfG n=1 Tax=Marinomonas aquimarina TaxID=295068 RepID=A0A1A8TPV9_9GAMM|nr:HD domain-containing phosphohydrolase [Marinomonas aquimarina]SBS34797.1 Cyclic di-GMP phosphodiesterase response regulator RpfG [Marinomonas aquimarina]
MNRYRQKSGISVRVLFSGSIIISMMLLAASLTIFSYLYGRSALNQQVEINAQQTTLALEKQIERVTSTAEQSVRLLQFDTITSLHSMDERAERLPFLASMIKMNRILSAIYVGYDDGDFFLLRSLESPVARERLEAPEGAQFLVQAIDRNKSGEIEKARWTFLDETLSPLQQITQPNGYHYDPRERPWFQRAQTQTHSILTEPYLFYTTDEVGSSFAINNADVGATVGVDASIHDLSQYMHQLTPSSPVQMAIVDQDGRLLGYNKTDVTLATYTDSDRPTLKTVGQLENNALAQLQAQPDNAQALTKYYSDDEQWYGIRSPLDGSNIQNWQLLYAVPQSFLLQDVNQNLRNQLLLSSAVILILMLFGWLVGRSISHPLHLLSEEVSKLSSFDFNRKIDVNSPVKEINVLSSLTDHMALTIHNFQSISHTLAHDPDLERMLEQVSNHLIAITSSKAGAVYLFNESKQEMQRATQTYIDCPETIPCHSAEWSELRATLMEHLDGTQQQLFLTPLVDRDHSILGVLLLQLPEGSHVNIQSFQHFMDEISGAAATAISTRRQLEAQQELLDAIIRLLADAIDAKSPYTSAHCERVPELAEMLAEAAVQTDKGELAKFNLNDHQRREFHIAAWLHDCGKITSPVHVVDKATKLETIYNRIHEVRTRFEVLWRDTDIEYLQGVLAGEDEAKLSQQKQQCQQQLTSDFAFVAQCNIGAEFMAEEDQEQLQRIAQQTWTRHFSDRLGLSQDEQQLLPETQETLPVQETLLTDKAEHIEPWGERRPAVEADNPDNIWGFDMELPEQAVNKGELYNLSIQRGTLTDEERFVIKDHMVQTIKMLSALPFPDEYKNVPSIAGNHHEQLNGSGYPRKLDLAQLSVQDRILAIADVFEALTASDRPYKAGHSLSKSLSILANMVKNDHLDGDLFKLFVESEVYLAYANAFLKPEQIDTVDKEQLWQLAGFNIESV